MSKNASKKNSDKKSERKDQKRKNSDNSKHNKESRSLKLCKQNVIHAGINPDI